jgi:hypothetical protein
LHLNKNKSHQKGLFFHLVNTFSIFAGELSIWTSGWICFQRQNIARINTGDPKVIQSNITG